MDQMCQLCNIFKAQISDFRTFNDVTSKYHSCLFCKELSNEAIREMQHNNLSPLDIGSESIDYTKIDFNILLEAYEYYESEVNKELTTESKLNTLLAIHRALTLRENN